MPDFPHSMTWSLNEHRLEQSPTHFQNDYRQVMNVWAWWSPNVMPCTATFFFANDVTA